jgi:hypothetical protein
MWLKRLVGITLITTLVGLFGITLAGVGFTRSDRITVVNPDGTTSEISAAEAAANPNLTELSTSNYGDPTSAQGATNPDGTPASGGTSSSASSSSSTSSSGTPSGGSSSGGSSNGGSASTGSTPKPVITMSISPATISTGASSTINWSATNSPSSCTASGSWSGTKAASGSQSTGAKPTAGTFTYTLSCTNSGGSSSASVNQTVNPAAVVYCGGQTTCYGVGDMAAHASAGNCWARTRYRVTGSYDRVFNLNTLASSGHGTKGASGFYSLCGGDFTNCVNGNGCGSNKNHSLSELITGNQYSQSRIGYYDPAKP